LPSAQLDAGSLSPMRLRNTRRHGEASNVIYIDAAAVKLSTATGACKAPIWSVSCRPGRSRQTKILIAAGETRVAGHRTIPKSAIPRRRQRLPTPFEANDSAQPLIIDITG